MNTVFCADPGEKDMDHDQAVKLMAVEQYLLDEMTSELRDEFEEHLFDCAECTVDLRAGSAFIREAKLQLPEMVAPSPALRPAAPVRPSPAPRPKSVDWFAWLRPAFAVPVFAAMLGVIAYQNIDTIPSLRASSSSPRLVPWVSYHTGTRGAARLDVPADRRQGAVVVIELSQEIPYANYVFDLYDLQGKRSWTETVSSSSQAGSGTGMFSLMIPGARLEQGNYTLVISGVTAQGMRTEIDRHIFDVHFED